MTIRFDGATEDARWLNPPAQMRALGRRETGAAAAPGSAAASGSGVASSSGVAPGSGVEVTTQEKTDFWQRTHYGFRADNGHFLSVPTHGDFTLTARVVYEPTHQYEQAGLMVRYDQENWIKTSVEAETDAPFRLGAVVTRAGYSDWSTQSIEAVPVDRWFRLERDGDDYTVLTRCDRDQWEQLRIAHLAPPAPDALLNVGVYCASPLSTGLVVHFFNVAISVSGAS